MRPLARALAGTIVAWMALSCASAASAADTSTVTVRPTLQDTTSLGARASLRTDEIIASYQLSQQEQAQFWGLTLEEMARATALLRGPRASFSVANLSPIEALGIHARSEGERRRYAELMVRAQHLDVERSLAWVREIAAAKQRLYPNDVVVSFEGLPPIQADPAEAALLNVPRSAVKAAPQRSPAR